MLPAGQDRVLRWPVRADLDDSLVSLGSFAAFVLPDLDGTVVVHDRCQNYVRHDAHCYITR